MSESENLRDKNVNPVSYSVLTRGVPEIDNTVNVVFIKLYVRT